MAADLITITSSVLPEGTRVAAFTGFEKISSPYELEIFLLVQGDELDLADAVGAKAQLVIDRRQDRLPPFYFSGVFASVELLHEIGGRSLVRVVLVPRLWLMGLSRHSRIFTKMSIVDIIKVVLDDNAIGARDIELRLGSYEPEEHVCQYRESDLAFISRWMEREGIFYFFEHGPNGEKLVLCDDIRYDVHPTAAAIPYFPQSGGDLSVGDAFRSFKCRHATLPTLVKLKDYDYAKPNLDVSGSAKVSNFGAGEVSLYGERFFSPGDGKRLAKLRAQELLARQVVHHAQGTPFHMRPGCTFDLADHPRTTFNVSYVTIEARHWGNQAIDSGMFKDFIDLPHPDTYFVELDAIPATTQFRPQSTTPWPRIYGFENGVVDGAEDSDYAQIDTQGRYSVKFRFDESDLKNGGASTFVRMMQPHGGGIEGFHFPLRKATEVVFSFLGGDPDRPVISGVVPNALTPSPVTSGNNTKNVIQTGGRNRLEIEDLAMQQRITLSTPYSNTYLRMGSPNDGHEAIISTDDNMYQDVGMHFNMGVGSHGGGSWTADVADDWKTMIGNGMKLDVGYAPGFVCAPEAPGLPAGTIDVKALSDIKVKTEGGNYSLDVDTGNWTTNVPAGTMTTTTKGAYSLTVTDDAYSATVKANHETTVQSGDYSLTVSTGNSLMDTTGTTTIESDGDITIESTAANIIIKAPTNIDITAGGEINQKASSTWYNYSYGDFFKFNLSSGVALTVGMSSETKVGIFNENLIGGKLEMALALKIEIAAGLTVKIGGGPAEIKMSNARLEASTAKVKNLMGPCVTSAIARLSRGSLHCYLP